MAKQTIDIGSLANDGTGDPLRTAWSKANANFTELYDWSAPMPSYTVATLPSAATAGMMIFVTDETGGATPAFSDGTDWRRVSDRAVVA